MMEFPPPVSRYEPRRSTVALLVIAVLLALAAFALALHGQISQPSTYHNFADQRNFLGISNAMDVLTSGALSLSGIFGLAAQKLPHGSRGSLGWIVFFAAMIATGLGSAYYHLDPNNDSLFWDRLPLGCAASALSAAVLLDYLLQRFTNPILAGFMFFGIGGVIYWSIVDDLRLYILVQLSPLLIVIILLVFTQTPTRDRPYLSLAVFFYLVSKAAEFYDHEVFAATAHILSGHSLKHLLAGAAVFAMAYMKRSHSRLGSSE